MPVDLLVPAEIHVKEMLLDAVLVSAKDVMVLLASVKRTNAFVTSHVVLNHKEAEFKPLLNKNLNLKALTA